MSTSAATAIPTLKWCEAAVCGVLVAGQSVLVALLLNLSPRASVTMALLAGVPLALICHRLLSRFGHRRHVQLTVAMFAAGGFGLLLGCIADFGSLGLYGLLSLCRSWSEAGVWPTLEQLSMKMNLMPGAWLGMVLGGNVAMALDALQRRRESIGRTLGTYGLCNAGMLLGMIVAEPLTTRVTLGLGQTAAGVAMVAAMLAGMLLGMNALLALGRALRFLPAFPAR